MADAGFAVFGDDRSTLPANGVSTRYLVVIAWDGLGELHEKVLFDQPPAFDLLTFDFSGKATAHNPLAGEHFFLSHSTEGKGQVLQLVADFLERSERRYRYVGIIDHDILIKISDIHFLLHVARCFDLDVFAPSLGTDAFFSFTHTLNRGRALLRPVPWIEIMMPFYKVDLFRTAAPFFRTTISSWGIDMYVIPLVQKITGLQRTAVIDGIVVSHVHPVQSGERLHSNGLNPYQEMEFVREYCMTYIETHYPELVGTDWFGETFNTLSLSARIKRKFRRWMRGEDPLEIPASSAKA